MGSIREPWEATRYIVILLYCYMVIPACGGEYTRAVGSFSLYCYIVILLYCYIVILLYCYIVILLYCYSGLWWGVHESRGKLLVILLYCYIVIPACGGEYTGAVGSFLLYCYIVIWLFQLAVESIREPWAASRYIVILLYRYIVILLYCYIVIPACGGEYTGAVGSLSLYCYIVISLYCYIVIPACGGEYTGAVGSFSFPTESLSTYPHNVACGWRITTSHDKVKEASHTINLNP